MSNKKDESVKFNQVVANMTTDMIGKLDEIALNNKTSRNEVIRIFCIYGIKNKKKFNLK
jgi:metal-responsive CopG/Arc/MetJ family transcriptional regulator